MYKARQQSSTRSSSFEYNFSNQMAELMGEVSTTTFVAKVGDAKKHQKKKAKVFGVTAQRTLKVTARERKNKSPILVVIQTSSGFLVHGQHFVFPSNMLWLMTQVQNLDTILKQFVWEDLLRGKVLKPQKANAKATTFTKQRIAFVKLVRAIINNNI